MIKTLAGHIGHYRWASLCSVACMIGEVVMDIATPAVMALLIDRGITQGNLPLIFRYGALMAVCAFLGLLSGFGGGRFAAYASSGFAANLRSALYESIQRFSFSNIDRYSAPGLVTRLTTDVTNIQNAYQMLIRMCMRSPAILIMALCMTVRISPRLSVIYFLAILFLGLFLSFIISHATKAFSEVFVRYDDLNSSVQENVRGIRAVKSFVREDYEIGRFRAAVDRICRLFIRAESYVCSNFPVMMVTVYSCMLAISWNGAHEIVEGRLTPGQLTSLFTYTMNILMSLMMLSMAFVMLTMSAASGRRVAEVLNEVPEIREPEAACGTVRDGSVVFDRVSFSYRAGTDGKPVLKDVSFSVKSGETIGIIGATGSSKTSLVSLIPRLYDVTEGSVKVGGRDVREYGLVALRDAVGMVLQKNQLFSGTVLENLRWGNPEATEEECREACRVACADGFLSAMPDGYESWIDQGGANLSGGQRQRLCIARALLKKPKILILDDSTSAVDTATDASIRRAFREQLPETTKFIISQRISGVKDADRIIVLDDGQVNGMGTHEELLKTNAIYRSVCEAQSEGAGDFDQPAAPGREG